jgi:hypothetical protein
VCAEIRGDIHIASGLDEIPKPVIVALLCRPMVVTWLIIGGSLTPLNPLEDIARCVDVNRPPR